MLPYYRKQWICILEQMTGSQLIVWLLAACLQRRLENSICPRYSIITTNSSIHFTCTYACIGMYWFRLLSWRKRVDYQKQSNSMYWSMNQTLLSVCTRKPNRLVTLSTLHGACMIQRTTFIHCSYCSKKTVVVVVVVVVLAV